MEQRQLGRTGPRVSVVGLGCNNFGMRIDAAASAAVVHAALAAGVTHFDTAEMYGGGDSETFLGAALGARRKDVVIATKFLPRPKDQSYAPGVVRKRIREGCEGSLRRLATDYIDLYYEHQPDPDAPLEEILGAFDELIAEGKIRSAAGSNYPAPRIQTVAPRGTLCALQEEWSLLNRTIEKEVAPAARRAGMGIVTFFPLASGMLTGKYRRGEEPPADTRFAAWPMLKGVLSSENFDRVESLKAFAESRGHSITEVAIAWLAARPEVASIIAGATSPAQVAANVAGAGWHLTPADLAEIDRLSPAV